MKDQRYEYPRINAAKIIVHCSSTNRILLLQEPETNNWMPNHWGLPGGKPIKNELLLDAVNRKINTDIGSQIELGGILKIEELIQGEKTILMFIFVANVDLEFEPRGEAKNYKWISNEEVIKMPITEFTEFYNPELIKYFFESKSKIIPLNFIEERDYNRVINDTEYLRWLKSGDSK